MSENDQPYSKPWEKYSLKELNGNCEWYTEGAADFETVIKNLNPSCPKCGKKLNTENHLRKWLSLRNTWPKKIYEKNSNSRRCYSI